MNIKTRILLSAISLQLLGFLVLIHNYDQRISDAVLENQQRQVRQAMLATIHHLDAVAEQSELSAQGLARAGEVLFEARSALSAQAMTEHVQRLLMRSLGSFENAFGNGLWFEPYALFPARRFFGPYAYRQDQELHISWAFNHPEYNYHEHEWYRQAIPADWDQHAPRPKKTYWTPPYIDSGTSAHPILTLAAPMYDAQQRLIGISTVDWSLTAIMDHLASLQLTSGSQPFLFHSSTGVYEFKSQQSTTFQPTTPAWSKQLPLLNHLDVHSMTLMHDDQEQLLLVSQSRSGMLIGVRIPTHELLTSVQQQTKETLLIGAVIVLVFTIIIGLLLELLFRPFDTMLALLRNTLSRNEGAEQPSIHPIRYAVNNEFQPIVKTYNHLVQHIGDFTQQLSESNAHLQKQQAVIAELNSNLELKVAQRTAELASKNDEAVTALQQLKLTQKQLINAEKHAAIGELVAGLAHEINTPIGIGVTAMSALEEHVDDIDQLFQKQALDKSSFRDFIEFTQESVSITHSNLRKAADLMGRFKQVAVDQASEHRRDFELTDYLQSVCTSLLPSYKYRPIRIDLQCPEKVFICTYPGALSQVITNLIMNSLQHAYTPSDSGKITINAQRVANHIVIRYHDDGHGMAAETRSRLFEPFFTTERQQGGSGLGGHIIHTLVTDVLGGTITLASELGHGTEFIMTLPCTA